MTDQRSFVLRLDQGISVFATSLICVVYGALLTMIWPVFFLIASLNAVQIAIRTVRYYRAKRADETHLPEPLRIMINNRVLPVWAEWTWLFIAFAVTAIAIQLRGGTQ